MTSGNRRTRERAGLGLMLPAMLLIGTLYAFPLVRLAALSFGEQGFSLDAYRHLFGDWNYAAVLYRTFHVSVLVVLGCLVFGYPIAYVLAFATPRRRALLSLLVLLPYWTNVLVRNFAWLYLLRNGGVLSTLVGSLTTSREPAQLLYNETGIVIGIIGTLLPLMVFPIVIAIAAQDRGLREAAASLGASPARSFFAITLPMSYRGIYTGCLLVFVTAVGFFIIPALLGGGRVQVAATFVNSQVQEFVDWPLAAAGSIVLLATVVALVILFHRMMGMQSFGADRAPH